MSGRGFVAAVIGDEDGRILLLRRALDRRLSPGLWGLPGGRIEAGESPEAAMERELGEEIGKDAQYRLVGRTGPVDTVGLDPPEPIHLFRYQWIAGQVQISREHLAFTWVDPRDFEGLELMPGVREDLALLYFHF